MPHAGLMDENRLGPSAGPLMRARLHIRGARRRLRQGKVPAGIVTIYDAIMAAMDWYIATPERKARLDIREDDNLNDDRSLFIVLKRSGIIDGTFDFDDFHAVLDRALRNDLHSYDYSRMLADIESFMTQLGVMPFNEQDLPAEDPATY